MNTFGIFKEPGCKLLDPFYFCSASKILGPLRRALSIFNKGRCWPRLAAWTGPHISVVLLTCASCGPTVKILTGVALVLKDGFQCWWDLKLLLLCLKAALVDDFANAKHDLSPSTNSELVGDCGLQVGLL